MAAGSPSIEIGEEVNQRDVAPPPVSGALCTFATISCITIWGFLGNDWSLLIDAAQVETAWTERFKAVTSGYESGELIEGRRPRQRSGEVDSDDGTGPSLSTTEYSRRPRIGKEPQRP